MTDQRKGRSGAESPAVDIKIESVKMEDIEHEEGPELGYCPQANPRGPEGDVMDTTYNVGIDSGQGRYVCSVCNECFLNEEALYDHVYRECGALLEMSCPLCSFQTDFIDDMRSHTALKHGDPPDLNPTCAQCGDTYSFFTGHLKNCDQLKNHKCPICFYNTKSKVHLKRHVQTVHPVEGIGRSTCTGCGNSFKNKHSLKTHLRICEKSNDKIVKFKCFHCSHETKWKFHLRTHIERVHLTGETDRHTCTACGKPFKHKDGLRSHTKNCEKMQIMEKCKLCSYRTSLKYNLQKHVARHAGAIVCSRCQRSYKSQESFRGHMKYCGKSEMVKFKCKLCDYETRWQNDMRRHIRRLHPVGDITQINCPGCSRAYSNVDSLKRHVKLCEKLNDRVLKFRCFHCSHETKWKYHLKQHIRQVHPIGGINRLGCPRCLRSYKNKESLKRHRNYCGKSDKEMVKFECKLCDYQTKWQNCMRRHTRVLHRDGAQINCTGCCKAFKSVDSLKKHMRFCEKSNSQVVKFRCFHCSHETKWKYHLKQHIRRVHPIGGIDRPTCTACGNSFKNEDCLKEHIRYCDKSSRYTCMGCGRSYKHQDRLKTHIPLCEKFNNKIVLFKCCYCCHETKWKHHLKEHIKRVHPVEAIDRAICTGCGKSFKNKDSLKTHLRFCEKSNAPIVMFKCFHCCHETKRKYYLKEHIKHLHPVGAINRPTCTGCQNSFKNIGSLKRHVRFCDKLNNHIVKFKCCFCSHETKWKNHLNEHVRRVHSVEATDRPTCIECGKSFKNIDSLKKHVRCCTKSGNAQFFGTPSIVTTT